ncbi:host attachment protein [Porticoccus sp.]
MSGTIWVLVADATQARLFSTTGSKEPLLELKDMLHSAGRSKISDLVTDQPGRYSGSGHTGIHGMEDGQDIKNQERDIFAREICALLEKSHRQQRFHRLYLVAPSHMLGAFHKHLGKDVKKRIPEEFDSLLVKLSPAEIRNHLPKYL